MTSPLLSLSSPSRASRNSPVTHSKVVLWRVWCWVDWGWQWCQLGFGVGAVSWQFLLSAIPQTQSMPVPVFLQNKRIQEQHHNMEIICITVIAVQNCGFRAYGLSTVLFSGVSTTSYLSAHPPGCCRGLPAPPPPNHLHSPDYSACTLGDTAPVPWLGGQINRHQQQNFLFSRCALACEIHSARTLRQNTPLRPTFSYTEYIAWYFNCTMKRAMPKHQSVTWLLHVIFVMSKCQKV